MLCEFDKKKLVSETNRGQKREINSFSIKTFCPPTQNLPCWTPSPKVHVPQFLGKNAKKVTHINFWGFNEGVPNGNFSATKGLVSVFSCPYGETLQEPQLTFPTVIFALFPQNLHTCNCVSIAIHSTEPQINRVQFGALLRTPPPENENSNTIGRLSETHISNAQMSTKKCP